jgi:probable F420-dependent oxidoreductase
VPVDGSGAARGGDVEREEAPQQPKCSPASSGEMDSTGRSNWRPITSAISRFGTPSSPTACRTDPAGAVSSARRKRPRGIEPAAADWLDPMIGLSFAAAATSRIGVATGVLLIPEHNPVLLAKQAASLDALSGGRLTLGIGVGWSREEFAALGVPFERRGKRAAEYVAAMRMLWGEDRASFQGEFVEFEQVRVYPKPVHDRRVPVIVGGNSDAALRRAAAWGMAGMAFPSRAWTRCVSGSLV